MAETKLFTVGVAAGFANRTPQCVSHWCVRGSRSAGVLRSFTGKQLAEDRELRKRLGLTAEEVEDFLARTYRTDQRAILRLDLEDYLRRLAGPGYPAGRPRKK